MLGTSVHFTVHVDIFCMFEVFPDKPDEDYWPVKILFTSVFFTLFDQSLKKSF